MVDTHRLKLAVVAAMLLALLAGCTPEAGRPRGAGYGSGGDPGNHPRSEPITPCSKVFNPECNP